MGRARSTRTPDSVRPRPAAAGALGYLDQHCGAARRLRSAIRRLPSRLVDAERSASARRALRDAHARGGHLVHRRSCAGCTSALRRTLRHSVIDSGSDRADEARRAAASSPSAPPSSARSSTRLEETGMCPPAPGSRPAGWVGTPGFASSTPSSQAYTRPTRVTTSCCGRSNAMTCSPGRQSRPRLKDYLAHEFGDAVLIVRSESGVTLVADEWQVASEMRQVDRAASAEPYLAAGVE